MTDRQISRWHVARVRLHEAQQHLRDAQLEVDAASAEAVTAASAIAERVLLLQPGPKPAGPACARTQGALAITETPLETRCDEGTARVAYESGAAPPGRASPSRKLDETRVRRMPRREEAFARAIGGRHEP